MIYLSCDNMKKIIYIISIFLIGINLIYAKETVKFSSCIDGDTFKVSINGEIKTVRMLAIDTPETEKPEKKADYYANEASDYTCQRIKKAKKIVLEYDPNSDQEDKYGRILAWVFLDGELLQTDLVKDGYAKVAYLYNDYKYTDTLIKQQEIASSKELGLWNTKQKENDEHEESTTEKYTSLEVIIITVLFLIFVLVSKLKK